jgi:phage antirepressor YoqD-like protein
MNELQVNEIRIDLIEDFSARKEVMEDCVRNIEVLENVKEILTLGNTEFITVQMAADYFDTPLGTIKSLISEHNEELVENGLITYKRNEFREFVLKLDYPTSKVQTGRGKDVATIGDIEINVTNKGITLISKRVLLNIGMLLRDSEVAKELRRRILDIVHDAEQGKGSIETIENEINEEERLTTELSRAILKGDMAKFMELTTKINELKNKRIVELEEQVEGYEGLIDSFINKNSLYSIRDVGKSLKGLKFNIKDGFSTFGANNVFHYLRDRGVLYYRSGQNKPYAEYEGKYIKMKLSEAINGWGQPVYVCYFTKDGIKWFFKKIVREGIIDKEHAKEVVKNMIPDERDDDIYPF